MKPVGSRRIRLHLRDHADADLMLREHRRVAPTARSDSAATAWTGTSTEDARYWADTPKLTSDRRKRNGSATITAPTSIKVLEGWRRSASVPAMYIGSTGRRASPPRLRGRRQLDRRGAGRLLRPDQRHDPHRQLGHGGRQRPRHPDDMHESGKSAAEVVLTVLHAGGKFDNESYKVSGGLHGVGVSVVNALSEALELEIWRNGQVYQQSYERGTRGEPLEITGTTKRAGRRSPSSPTPRSSKPRTSASTPWRSGCASWRSSTAASHHARRRARRQDPQVPLRGRHRVVRQHLNKNKAAVNEKPIYMRGEKDGIDAEIALQWNDGYVRDESTPSPTTSTPTRAARTSPASARR